MLQRFSITGDPYSLGFQLGRFSATVLRDIILPSAAFTRLATLRGSEWLASLEASARALLPGYVREIEGLAAGAGIDFSDVFLWHCRGDAPADLANGATGEGCSTLALMTADGLALGHNEDGDPALADHCALVDVMPTEGLGFTSFVYPGTLPGNAFALNHAGLVQTINNIRPLIRERGVPRHLAARAMLDCTGPTQAVARLRALDRASGYHHLLAAPGAPALSVEAPAGGIAVNRVDRAWAHTNHLTAPELARIPQHITRSSATRQARLTELTGGLPRGVSCTDALPTLLAGLHDTSTAPLPVLRRDPDDPDAENTIATVLIAITDTGVTLEVVDVDGRGLHEVSISARAD